MVPVLRFPVVLVFPRFSHLLVVLFQPATRRSSKLVTKLFILLCPSQVNITVVGITPSKSQNSSMLTLFKLSSKVFVLKFIEKVVGVLGSSLK